jgi:DNA-binding transcriptional LysR family regulator
MLDLYKLHIFTLVAREGSFSAAAQRLLMTQSGVSQHIQDLEHALGTALFVRGRRGVALTPAGETLLGYAEPILSLATEAENALVEIDQSAAGKVAIGATPGVGVYMLPDWMQAFRARMPGMTAVLQTGVTAQIVEEVRSRRIDLGFIEGELDDELAASIGVATLEQVEQHVVVGQGHAWWGRTSISLDALRDQPFIMRQPGSQSRRWLDQQLAQAGIQPRITAEFDNLESIKRSVSAGMCLTILPAYTVRQELDLGLLHLIPLEGMPLVRTLKLIWDERRAFAPPARAFLSHLETVFPGITRELRLRKPPSGAAERAR